MVRALARRDIQWHGDLDAPSGGLVLKEIIAAGGAGYLIPAVLFVVALYVMRGLFGLHGRRSQSRKDFLDLWDATRSQDDLWLEVAIRHLFGTYLPARVIWLALARPDKSRALLDLTALWPLLHFDPETQTVRWLHRRHESKKAQAYGRYFLLFGYFALALLGMYLATVAIGLGHNSFGGWVYGVCAVVAGTGAFACVAREDALRVAASVGSEWIARINQTAKHAAPTTDAPLALETAFSSLFSPPSYDSIAPPRWLRPDVHDRRSSGQGDGTGTA